MTSRRKTKENPPLNKPTARPETPRAEVVRSETAEAARPLAAPEQNFVPRYDVMSKERYVDSTSQKTEFDKVLDELASISKDMLEWDVLKMTKKHFGDSQEENARKLEAFFGAYIYNAAMELYDRGRPDAAFEKLERAKAVLEAKRKLAREMENIQTKADETAFDISDMLDLADG
ncbi:MAG: hypothetical protein LBL51_00145 [Synergistaceae bacterium]|jgi:hypothetical protein|nr:hypothetical protein [Synergistaceae bacterium]